MRENRTLVVEFILRIILFVVFTITDNAEPYHRALQPEEMWLYRYPHMVDYYPGELMWITVYSVPTVVLLGFFVVRKDLEDLIQAALGVTMSLYVTGCITNFIKLAVGRPRPDFLSRCFPEGIPDSFVLKDTLACSGSEESVLQGLKSFPSGHASLSFSSLGYVSLYIAGKLHVFNRGRGNGWRFASFIFPLVWALMIAVSRTSDYHHHWQDVTVGSLVGLVVCYTCYRQVYPSLSKLNSHLCYTQASSTIIDYHDTYIPEPNTPTSPYLKSRDAGFKFDAKII